MAAQNTLIRWILLCTIILTAIVLPFIIFGAQIETWSKAALTTADEHSLTVALLLGGLLASDILLPVPSSIVSTACGLLLGFTIGTMVSFIGMVISCTAGYYLALGPGRFLAQRLLGDKEIDKLGRLSDRFGDWVIVLARPVPVLAEASVLFAGMGKMKPSRFFLMSTVSNLVISATYAAIGHFSAEISSFLLAGAASILIPFLLLVATRKGYPQNTTENNTLQAGETK
jgi:uncharacterized membrane protein YdjX (TVP38/TMEM64 family)